jgi:FkbM family methyltransferase
MKQLLKRIGHRLLQNDLNATMKYRLREFLDEKHLNQKWCLYDIGAHHGGYSRGWAKRYPNDEIIMFEASPSKEPVLKSTGFKYIIEALGEKEDTKTFYESGSTGDSFYLPRDFNKNQATISMKVVPLDKLVESRGLRMPDFIKMDVQGSELSVIKGGKRSFHHARFLLIEMSLDDYFNKQNPLIGDVIPRLAEIGFSPLHIFEIQRRSHSDLTSDPISQLNLLFAKQEKQSTTNS